MSNVFVAYSNVYKQPMNRFIGLMLEEYRYRYGTPGVVLVHETHKDLHIDGVQVEMAREGVLQPYDIWIGHREK